MPTRDCIGGAIVSKKNKKRNISASQQGKSQNNNRTFDTDDLASIMMGNNFGSNSKPQKKMKNSERKKRTNTRNSNTTVTSNGGVMAFAPYNFVPFTKKVHSLKADKQISHAIISEELYSGVIEYEIEAKTPIFVDNGRGEFHKNQYGNYSIPGSTMRGLIRSNVQVLGLASMGEDIDDYELMYRNVAGRRDRDKIVYSNIMGAGTAKFSSGNKVQQMSVLKNVRAGYIYNKNGSYIIYQTAVDKIDKQMGKMNYYILSERKIVSEYIESKNKNEFPYQFFLTDDNERMQHKINSPFVRSTDRRGKIHYTGIKSEKYKPYFQEVSYKVKNMKDVIAVGELDCYEKNGYVISSGEMNEKKAIYIIPQVDETKEPIKIPEKDVRAFKIDIEKRANKLKNFGGRELFDLPKEGEIKPVFYIQLNGRLYFGFTPRLRLFYPSTIKKGMPTVHKSGELDYAKSIFGYVDKKKKKSYKSKVSFTDAVVIDSVGELEERKYILGEPSPTCYMNYLEQDEYGTTYNSDEFCLRGMKQYWLKNKIESSNETKNKENEKVISTLNLLPAYTKFRGKVRYRNLTKEELGLLLWSIRLEENSWMNLGKAKAYGCGAVKINIISAKNVDIEKAYSFTEFHLNPYKDIEVDEMIDIYKTSMNKELKEQKIDNLLSIKSFFDMKNAEKILDESKTVYMSLDDYKQKNALPKVKDLIE